MKLGNKGKLSSLPALSHHSGAQMRTQLSEADLSHSISCERYFLGGKTGNVSVSLNKQSIFFLLLSN